MKHIFIINPVSGKKDPTQSIIPKIQQAAAQCKVQCSIELTRYPGHAGELARRHAASGELVRLYVCGGDGTLNEVFNGVYSYRNAQVAHVPCGSGNDFLRNFGSYKEFSNIVQLMQGIPCTIYLMLINGRVCAAVASTGIDAEVAYNIPTFRRLPFCSGSMAYNISIGQQLLRPMGRHFCVEADGRAIEGDEYLLAAVCNGAYYGGGYCAAPASSLEDGLLDLVLVKRISRLKIAGVLSVYKAGGHITADGTVRRDLQDIVLTQKVKRLSIYPTHERERFVLNIDGECAEAEYLEARVLPGAGNFVVPAEKHGYNCHRANPSCCHRE